MNDYDEGFTLDLECEGDNVHVEVSGYSDVRTAIAGLINVFTDEGYVSQLWSGLVDDSGDDDEEV